MGFFLRHLLVSSDLRHSRRRTTLHRLLVALADDDDGVQRGGQVTIFQPQLDNFQGDQLSAHAAVAVQMPGAAQPTYGAIWLQSQVSIDRAARTVQVIQVTIPRIDYPGYDAPTTQSFTDAIQQALMASPATLSLDQLLEMLQAVQTAQQQATDLQNSPPRIIFLQHPADEGAV